MPDAWEVFERAFRGDALDELLREGGEAAFRHGCHIGFLLLGVDWLCCMDGYW
jgi:hypothetical protein